MFFSLLRGKKTVSKRQVMNRRVGTEPKTMPCRPAIISCSYLHANTHLASCTFAIERAFFIIRFSQSYFTVGINSLWIDIICKLSGFIHMCHDDPTNFLASCMKEIHNDDEV